MFRNKNLPIEHNIAVKVVKKNKIQPALSYYFKKMGKF